MKHMPVPVNVTRAYSYRNNVLAVATARVRSGRTYRGVDGIHVLERVQDAGSNAGYTFSFVKTLRDTYDSDYTGAIANTGDMIVTSMYVEASFSTYVTS